ncbi:reverse transcriptase, partial [Globisporangium splendens]
MQRGYSRFWGFNDAVSGRLFSAWSGAPERRGGVAILLNPYSSIQTIDPYLQDKWTAHWMAAKVQVFGTPVLLINCYAPSGMVGREALFNSLRDLELQHDGPVFCGGDYNCTLLGAADRSYTPTVKHHDSGALRKLIEAWNLVDVLTDDALEAVDAREIPAFQKRHHTYFYTLPGGGTASSRLDRWYCSRDHEDWVRNVAQSVAAPYSDHNGVTIRVAPPDKVIQRKLPRKVYPVPVYAEAQGGDATAAFFAEATTALSSLIQKHTNAVECARATADWWDNAKLALRKSYINAKKVARTKITNSYRQRIARLQAKLDTIPCADRSASGPRPGEQGVEPEGQTTVAQLRRAIADCKTKWQRAKKQALLRDHSYHPTRSSQHFFRRVSTKFMDNTIYTLGGRASHGPNRSRELADDMMRGWRATMQQTPCKPDKIRCFLEGVSGGDNHVDLSSICAPIQEDEVKLAIRKCQRGKAHGPDELGNDWYRDCVTDLVPLMTTLFNTWLARGVIPSSFGAAHVQCIKKSRTSATPLEHRPIALLNSDYKVFTRIFATRLRPMMPLLVHAKQAGFVPGRYITTVIDTLNAAKAAANSNPALRRALALLLDFAKAYDSLDRDFLTQALESLGFQVDFVRLVSALHANTSCQFMVNGFLSRSMAVTCGIRQGCPLAPLLFILALEMLYRKIEKEPLIRGVQLSNGETTATIKVSGFADDTTIYVQDPSEVPAVLKILDDFGAASGLKINVAKSLALPLHQQAAVTRADVHGLAVMGRQDHCRYLGIQIGQTAGSQANWDNAIKGLQARLHLARIKTNSVAQRALLAKAVIIPKVLYVARHEWPTVHTVNRLQQLVKRFVWGTRAGEHVKAWMAEEQAELPLRDGGLGIPDVRCELITHATTAVARWAANSCPFVALVGDVLQNGDGQGTSYITPVLKTRESRTHTHGPRYHSTLWTTGARNLSDARAMAHTDSDIADIKRTATAFLPAFHAAKWDQSSFTVRLDHKIDPWLRGLLRDRSADRGPFCDEWLPYASISVSDWLIDRNGSRYQLSTSTGIAEGCRVLRDLVEWTWVAKGVLTFRLIRAESSPSGPTRRVFERLCAALVYNFPHLLYRPRRRTLLRPTETALEQHHEWNLDMAASSLTHSDATLHHASRPISTTTSCDVAASLDVPGSATTFHAHPHLSRLVQVWGGKARWKPNRRRYLLHSAQRRRSIGQAFRDAAIAKQAPEGTGMNQGLTLLKWKELYQIPGVSSYCSQTLVRLKANKTPLWNRVAGNLSCPHSRCGSKTTATPQHVFWDCPIARAAWNRHLRQWGNLGFQPTEESQLWIFSLDLLDMPATAWESIREHLPPTTTNTDHYLDELFPVAHMLWRHMAATTIHGIWCARLRKMETPSLTEPAITAVLNTSLHSSLLNLQRLMISHPRDSTDSARGSVLRAFVDTLRDPFIQPLGQLPTSPADTGGRFLLFFDGGSRGNPGPGGSGAVIVWVHAETHTAKVVWIASMAYGHRSTTNNTAEYWGLVHGLREAYDRSYVPLNVIGDSAIIISQQRRRRPPKNARLLVLYHKARRIADVIGVQSWTHHYRSYNKMADKAANIAMDTHTSQQANATSGREIFRDINQFRQNDVMHWLEGSGSGNADNCARPSFHDLPHTQVHLLREYLDSVASTKL